MRLLLKRIVISTGAWRSGEIYYAPVFYLYSGYSIIHFREDIKLNIDEN
jgi:hypothetical protein